jgi:S-DNA-T family DNA segregation ATPase FtsK/SpoIIIE
MSHTGRTVDFCDSLIYKPEHILIAGQTGSGKTVIINDLMNSILYSTPNVHQLVLIDPKRVGLSKYRNTPYCMAFAVTREEIEVTLQKVVNLMNTRFAIMEQKGANFYPGSKVHVVIDEMAEIMLSKKSKRAAELLQSIAQMGRAANIQLICATQCPLTTVIPTVIKVNFGVIIGLHTRNWRDSINIIDTKGCERLPKYGKALVLYANGDEPEEINVPMITDSELRAIINYRTYSST